MIHNITLPQGTLMNFRRADDAPPILSVEAVYLDMILASSQRSTHQRKVNEDDRLWWLPAFTALVNQKYNLDLSDTEGWVIARAVTMVGDTLKKTFENIRTSLQSLESTPSNSPPANEKPSTSPSPAPAPDENYRQD